MTTRSRTQTIRLLILLLVLAATACSREQQRAPVAEQTEKRAPITAELIAKAHGVDSFGDIEAIRYTWNAEFPGTNISRAWIWEPKKNQVSYEGKDKGGNPVKATYVRSELNGQPANVKDEIDPAFVNDNYWLLFPLHAYWDKSPTVTDQGTKPLPIGNGSAELVSVKYPSEGGYTPGDTWDLYVDKENRVQQMVYHRGGPRKPSLVSVTWDGYKKAGPLFISTAHNGTADGNQVRIFFTDVAVRLTGLDNWVDAQ